MLDRSNDASVALAIAQQYRLVRLQGRNIDLLNSTVQRYRIPDRRSIDDVLAEMSGDARIRSSQPNYLYRLLEGAKKKQTRRRKSRHQYALKKSRVSATHTLATGKAVRVVVIDSGIDTKHPEFANGMVKNYNAVRQTALKPDAHGTAVAGVIGARTDMIGIAPEVALYGVRAFVRESRKDKPRTDSFVLAHALDWAASQKAQIVNLSFAGPRDPLIRDTVAAALKTGAVLVAAAGNGGPKASPAFPAAYPGVIAVTATDKRDRLYAKANRGTYISVAAPGVGIFAPVPRRGYDFKTGTSFAAPHVTGLIALMLERRPTLTHREILSALTTTAIDLGAPGTDIAFGAGRMDAYLGLQAILTGRGKDLATRESAAGTVKP